MPDSNAPVFRVYVYKSHDEPGDILVTTTYLGKETYNPRRDYHYELDESDNTKNLTATEEKLFRIDEYLNFVSILEDEFRPYDPVKDAY